MFPPVLCIFCNQANTILYFQASDGEGGGSTGHSSASVVCMSLRHLASLCELEEDEVLASGVLYWLAKGVLKEVSVSEATPAAREASEAVPIDPYGPAADQPDKFFVVAEENQAALAALDAAGVVDGTGNSVQDDQVWILVFGFRFSVYTI
jgi:hypothetical protein